MFDGVDLYLPTPAPTDDIIFAGIIGLEHAIGRQVDGTENAGRSGTTVFLTSGPVTSYGIPYPGISSKTPEQIKEKLAL